MSFFSWLRNGKRKPNRGRGAAPKPGRFRLQFEALENRMLPCTYYPATASDLIADINAANKSGGANTIVLTAPTNSPYVLTAVNNSTDGPTGLPVISKKDSLTIVGNGDTIDASRVGRLFDVAGGGLCVLGGTVTLMNDVVETNTAGWYDNWGPAWEYGYGGGIYVASGVTISIDSFTQANTFDNTPNNLNYG
jgi:hypothetical protein